MSEKAFKRKPENRKIRESDERHAGHDGDMLLHSHFEWKSKKKKKKKEKIFYNFFS